MQLLSRKKTNKEHDINCSIMDSLFLTNTHWDTSGAVIERFISTGRDRSSLSCTAVSSVADCTVGSTGKVYDLGITWCKRWETGSSAKFKNI